LAHGGGEIKPVVVFERMHEIAGDIVEAHRGAGALCAGHAQQSGGESPLPNLMEVKG
jgi:hypothetical protein